MKQNRKFSSATVKSLVIDWRNQPAVAEFRISLICIYTLLVELGRESDNVIILSDLTRNSFSLVLILLQRKYTKIKSVSSVTSPNHQLHEHWT